MRSLWLIAKHEYRRTVLRRAFILITLAIPLGMVALIAVAMLVPLMSESNLPIGYVDKAGILGATRRLPSAMPSDIEIRAFPDEEAAVSALERSEIQAFFVFPADYPSTLHTDLYYLEEPPSSDVWGEFNDFVRLNLVATYPHEVRTRLFEGPNVTVHDIVSNREFSRSSIIETVVMPFVASFFFFVATMAASNYMLRVVADEKENRTMEIMITSVTPGQLIGGKTVGLLAAALTQLSVYVIAALIGLAVAAPRVEALQQARVPWTYLAVMVLFFLPTYALRAAVMVAIGGAVTKLQQGEQVAAFLNLFFMFPIFLMMVIFENPGHPLIVFLSLFPTTAFLTISLRWGLGTIPL